jgi:hypothetical protein
VPQIAHLPAKPAATPAEASRAPPVARRPATGTSRKANGDPARSSILPVGTKSSSVVELSSPTFQPSQAVVDEITASGSKGLDVRVIVKGLTQEGTIKVRQDKRQKFDSTGRGSMPLLHPWTQKLGGMHLNFDIADSTIKNGLASFKARGGDKNDWLQALKKDSTALGGLGLKINNLPSPVNKFENGKLQLGVTGLKVGVGGYVDAEFDLLLENMAAPKISGSAKIDIRGAVQGELKLETTADQLTGSVSLATDYKSFSGAIKVTYLADGTVDISGKAAYSADKLSGEIRFVATDLDSANKFARDAITAAGGKENVQNAAAPIAVPIPKQGQKKLALAATGLLAFNLTKWFAGTVNVVVDGKGAVTVIGKIAPPGEIILFNQRDWDKQLVKFEAKAYYGIPVVGNLNLFANISLNAIAKLGPAKLYAIEILGTYSTDPEIQKSIQISGSLNVSAYAGLRLRAEGGAGIEILDHDLKFGVGLTADVGVKAYTDARPTIGYRDPGVFYISGTLDMVAQPMLGLGGDFFIAVSTPWWSPLSDKRWTWPLFSKEWPLSDPIGISATLKDYVLGSGTVPEIEMKKPEFDPSKFMTNMVDDNLPNKSGKGSDGKGSFKEDGSVAKPVIPPKKNSAKTQPTNLGKKGGALKGGKSDKPDANAAKDAANSKNLQIAAKKLNTLKGKGPFARGDLDKELAAIKAQASGVSFDVQAKDAKWLVTPKAGGKGAKGKPKATGVELGATPQVEWWKDKLGFTNAAGEKHTLQFIGKGPDATLAIATTLQSIRSYLDKHPARKSPDPAMKQAWDTANSVFEKDLKIVFGFGKKDTIEIDKRKEADQVLADISVAFIKLSGDLPSDVDYGENAEPTYGNPATVLVIHTKPKKGSEARKWPDVGIWQDIREAGLTKIVDRWLQMHIIADNLGGSGDLDANLIPAPNSINRGPFYAFENKTIELVGGRSNGVKNRVWFSVSVSGSKTAPTGISGKTGLYLWKGGTSKKDKWMKMPTPLLSVDVNIPKPNLTGVRKFSLNFTSPKVMIKEFHLTAKMAKLIYQGRPYADRKDWARKMVKVNADPSDLAIVNALEPIVNE